MRRCRVDIYINIIRSCYFFVFNWLFQKKVLYLLKRKELDKKINFMNMKNNIHFGIDKLEVTYTCPPPVRKNLGDVVDEYEQGAVSIRRLPPTHYANNFSVYYEGVYIGVLSFGTYNPNRPNLYLTVDNELLYSNIELIYMVEKELGLLYYRISKLDICMDTPKNVVERFYDLLHDKSLTLVLNNKKLIDRKKIVEDILHISTGSLTNVRKNREFCIKGYEFELKGYNKAIEIQRSGKRYIKDHLGMEKIYRMEFSYKNYRIFKEQLDLTDINHTTLYNNLSNQNILKTIFDAALYRILHISPSTPILEYLFDTKKRHKSTFNIFNIQNPRPLFDNRAERIKNAI